METLDLIKEDFIDTEFLFGEKCAIEKAYFRATGKEVCECITHLQYVSKFPIGMVKFEHDYYGNASFKEDKQKAAEAKNGEVIRTIHLTKV